MLLYLIGILFIFMNVMIFLSDMCMLMYEVGYVVYSCFINYYKFKIVKCVFFEVVELVVMSMELLIMEYWDVFFEDLEELWWVKINQLEYVFKVLLWIVMIDKFQYWVYMYFEYKQEDWQEVWM